MNKAMFKGSLVAIVTPMQIDGSIDVHALQTLVEWHIANSTDGIIVSGTTGESATLDHTEQAEVIELVVKQVAGRIPVIAGTGSNSTKTALSLTLNAKQIGVDACLVVTPYYNKPTQNGLYEHYKFVAEKSDLPIILYNVPARTACDLLPETVARLAKLTQIVGIKEATGNKERAQAIKNQCPAQFQIWSGDDPTGLDLMEVGAEGIISVTANVAPLAMHQMCEAALKQDMTKAKQINDSLMPLHRCLFLESNPIPTKWALHHMGKIQAGIRLPLLPLDKSYHQKIKDALESAGLMRK